MIIDLEIFLNAIDEYVDPYEEGGVILALRKACVSSDDNEEKYLNEEWKKLP